MFHLCERSSRIRNLTIGLPVCKTGTEEFCTTVGYLIGETKEAQSLKDPMMLKRFQEIDELNDKDKECIYTLLDCLPR